MPFTLELRLVSRPTNEFKQRQNVRFLCATAGKGQRINFSIDLGILRMIKLFAWVSYTLKNIEKHRDEELNELKKSRFLQAALGMSNEIIPVIAKIIVIMIYVSSFI